MIRTITHFEVSDDFSEDGRGDYIKVLANFSTKAEAEIFAKGRGNYGKDAQVIERVVNICDTIFDIGELRIQEKVQKALNKLTEEEKTLLGLSGKLK